MAAKRAPAKRGATAKKPAPRPAPVTFANAAAFRRWLTQHHASATELLIRLFKTTALARGLGYQEALDEVLCFGWIDGVRRGLDHESFTIRFTPRKPGSRWSLINVRHVERLEAAGRMHAAGRAAFRARDADDPRRYSFETKPVALAPEYARRLRANAAARRYYESEAPWYRRTSAFWVMSAKREATRERRLATLIDCCARGVRIGPLAYNGTKKTQRPTRRTPKR